MKTLFLFFVLFAGFFTTIHAQIPAKQNEAEWLGTYSYVLVLDRNPSSGYQDSIEYKLKVFRRADQILVRYTADGYRTWDDYECRIELNGNQLKIYYQSDLREGELGSSDRSLKKGLMLGALVKTVVRGKVRYTLKNASLIDLVRSPVFRKRK